MAKNCFEYKFYFLIVGEFLKVIIIIITRGRERERERGRGRGRGSGSGSGSGRSGGWPDRGDGCVKVIGKLFTELSKPFKPEAARLPVRTTGAEMREDLLEGVTKGGEVSTRSTAHPPYPVEVFFVHGKLGDLLGLYLLSGNPGKVRNDHAFVLSDHIQDPPLHRPHRLFLAL